MDTVRYMILGEGGRVREREREGEQMATKGQGAVVLLSIRQRVKN